MTPHTKAVLIGGVALALAGGIAYVLVRDDFYQSSRLDQRPLVRRSSRKGV